LNKFSYAWDRDVFIEKGGWAIMPGSGTTNSAVAKENTLTIRGEKPTNDEEKIGEVLYQGIAARTFERSFQLADYVQVKGASLENGLLHVDLVREIREAMKPRAIPIASSSQVLQVNPTKVAA
jgi:molecular chaperone IbpA